MIWLAATFGGTTNLAQVGALGRLGLLVGFFSNLGQVVFLPKLVQIADERTFRARFFQFGLFLAASPARCGSPPRWSRTSSCCSWARTTRA